MFAKSVIGSARFLRMPASSRLLYYDLGMQADDDGIVEAFAVMRTTGATEDDLRVLASKGFVRVLNEDLVTYIQDWKKNNLIKTDRYHASIYKDLLVQISTGTQMEPTWNQPGTQMEPEVRLGKDRLGKDSGEGADKPPRSKFVPPTAEEVQDYCAEKGYYSIDPQLFVAHYEANGWVQSSGRPIKNWKSAVVTWVRRDKESGKAKEDNHATEELIF